MSIAPTLLVVALMAEPAPTGSATGSEEASPPVPAPCIADLGPDPVEPPGLVSRLLPTLVVGLDHRRDHRLRSRRELSYTGRPVAVDDPVRYRSRDRRRSVTWWRLQLRWDGAPTRATSAKTEPVEPPVSPYCTALLEAEHDRPTSLEEALDHWVAVSRNRALIEANHRPGGTDE